jgi:hypothetical protein
VCSKQVLVQPDLANGTTTLLCIFRANHQQNEIVGSVCELKCWYRIWQQDTFYYIDSTVQTMKPIPLPVQAWLKCIARERMVSVHHDILKKLEVHIQKPVQSPAKFWLWASLWQLMFIYISSLTQGPAKGETSPTSALPNAKLATQFRIPTVIS